MRISAKRRRQMEHRKRRNRQRHYKPNPHYLEVSWSKMHAAPTPEMLRYLWGAVCHDHSDPVRFIGGGESFKCFANVAEQIHQHGGAAVVGWALQKGAPDIGHRNRLARHWIDAHCIWQSPDGELLDVTPGYDNALFVANPWGLITNMSCFFLDHSITVAYEPVHSLVVQLQPVPEFTPLPLRPITGKVLAETIIHWRFTNDQEKAVAIRQCLEDLIQGVAVGENTGMIA